MKKTFVTLVAAATLVAAVAPVATAVLAEDTYQPVDTRAVAIAAEFGRVYAVRQAEANLAKTDAEAAAKALLAATKLRIEAENSLKALLQAYEAAKTDYASELAKAVEADKAQGPGVSARAEEVRNAWLPERDAFEENIDAARETLKEKQNEETTAKAKDEAAKAALDAAVKALEKAYQDFINAGGKPENLPSNPAAPAAPAAPARAVPAAQTPQGNRALPRTSAVK